MKIIQSLQNPLVKELVELHDKKGREKHQKFIAHGIRTISELMHNGWQPLALLATEQMLFPVYQQWPDLTCIQITDAIAQKITPSSTASGLIAVFAIPAQPELRLSNAGVALVDIQDPGNIGTLMRSAAAMGLYDIVIVGGCDPYHPKVVQASAGTLAVLNIHQCTWQELINLQDRPALCAMVVQDGTSFEQLPTKKVILVIGNEANGLNETQQQACDYRVTIHMPGTAESLNAAIAGSIGMYEITRLP